MSKLEPPDGLCALVRADARRLKIGEPTWFKIFACLVLRPGFLAAFLYRLSVAAEGRGRLGRIAAKMVWRLNVFVSACDISPRAIIGPGLHLPHPMGIVIGEATIGAQVRILQNVAIGMGRFSDIEHDPASYPQIGDAVMIGAGAVLAGSIKIGQGAVIGANAVVTRDVAAAMTVGGVPARPLYATVPP